MKKLLRLVLFSVSVLGLAALAAEPANPIESPAKQARDAEQNYWLTIKSGIRHNSKCPYYHHSNGRPCTKDEGRACKKCGG